MSQLDDTRELTLCYPPVRFPLFPKPIGNHNLIMAVLHLSSLLANNHAALIIINMCSRVM